MLSKQRTASCFLGEGGLGERERERPSARARVLVLAVAVCIHSDRTITATGNRKSEPYFNHRYGHRNSYRANRSNTELHGTGDRNSK